jgi:uncharacterized protein (DUF362 family)/Pyruvate/2-oxoacid:ferredoxin oxidoreductase delta subunit
MDRPEESRVVLLRCKNYDPELIDEKIKKGIDLLGGLHKFFQKGEKILLKPNLLAPDPPESAVTTHPAVFASTAKILLEHGVAVSYGDSPGFYDFSRVSKKAGLYDKAVSLDIPEADFKSKSKIYFKEGKQNRVFEIAQGVIDSDGIVSLPKLKTHGLTLLTGAIKNQFGCIPGMMKAGFHAKLATVEKFSQMLVDLTMLLKPRLYIMDAILAMEGNGPRRGNAVPLGILLLSTDPVAVDTVAANIVGLHPESVVQITKGCESGLGTSDNIEVMGDDHKSLYQSFKLPRHRDNYQMFPPFLRSIFRKFFISRPVIHRKICTKCHECYKICPTLPKSIYLREDNFPKHNYATCINCYCCQETCPAGAITIKIKIV